MTVFWLWETQLWYLENLKDMCLLFKNSTVSWQLIMNYASAIEQNKHFTNNTLLNFQTSVH